MLERICWRSCGESSCLCTLTACCAAASTTSSSVSPEIAIEHFESLGKSRQSMYFRAMVSSFGRLRFRDCDGAPPARARQYADALARRSGPRGREKTDFERVCGSVAWGRRPQPLRMLSKKSALLFDALTLS